MLGDRLRRPVPLATPATLATHEPGTAATVATVATVAVATIPSEARYWRLGVTFPGSGEQEIRTLPEVTLSEAKGLWPGAAIRPIEETGEGI